MLQYMIGQGKALTLTELHSSEHLKTVCLEKISSNMTTCSNGTSFTEKELNKAITDLPSSWCVVPVQKVGSDTYYEVRHASQ